MLGNSREFIESSRIDVLVPQATDHDVEELLSSGDGYDEDNISSVEQRSMLYFDESISAYIVLRTPFQDDASLKFYFDRLLISLEVQAYGFLPGPSTGQDGSKENSPSRNEDTLWSGTIEKSKDPIIIVQGEDEDDPARHLQAIWKTTIPLSRPRMRLQSPTIVFKPTAVLQPSKGEGGAKLKDPYLPSCVPASTNLLESLKGDPAAQGAGPMLSAARLSRISPLSNDEGITDCTLKASSPKAFRALPAVSTRVRYSRANDRGGKPSIIASLDIETAPFSTENLNLTAINMELSDGTAVYLGTALVPMLPLNCRPKDNLVFLFRLTPQETPSDGSNQTSAKTVLITVHATVLSSISCQPRIEMRWKTGVDFSTALNPTYGAPGQSMQRPRRPSSLSRPPSTTNFTGPPSTARERDSASESIRTRKRALSVSDFGVSITFTGPKTVKVGRQFSWEVLVLNCSSKSRPLSLTVITKWKKGSAAGHQSRISNSSASGYRDMNIADAVIDENILYAMQRNLGIDTAQVISLGTDVRIGTLNPDSCINLELELLPLARGYLQVEAVRVTDVASNESIDIRDLPDILVEEQSLGK